MNKPKHKTYDNCTFPDSTNAGMDEMESYYEPLLDEALAALRDLVSQIERYEATIRLIIETSMRKGLNVDKAKEIIKKADKEINKENPGDATGGGLG